jgi:hypothetical protein
MKRFTSRFAYTTVAAFLASTALALGSGPTAAQQTPSEVAEDRQAKQLSRQHLNGPRFGFTAFTGAVADQRAAAGKEAIMTQFGWQFETQIGSSRDGSRALMEWVFLIGGVEQDELNASLGWLAGYRLENGLEFGVGPNISITKDSQDPTTSMLVAAGATMPFGDLYIPMNLAVSMAEGGPRITALLGWIVG